MVKGTPKNGMGNRAGSEQACHLNTDKTDFKMKLSGGDKGNTSF